MIDENTFYDEEYYEETNDDGSSKFVNNFLSFEDKIFRAPYNFLKKIGVVNTYRSVAKKLKQTKDDIYESFYDGE